jgi:hypothetical protein
MLIAAALAKNKVAQMMMVRMFNSPRVNFHVTTISGGWQSDVLAITKMWNSN